GAVALGYASGLADDRISRKSDAGFPKRICATQEVQSAARLVGCNGGRLMQIVPITSFIGEDIPAGTIGFELVRPQDGQAIGHTDEAGEGGVEAAVKAAKAAFAANRKSPTHQRAAWLKAGAAALTKNADELANLICEDVGKPIRVSKFE